MVNSHHSEIEKRAYLEEEAFMILKSGELPEVAYHASIYHLGEDPEGPGLKLDAKELMPLKDSVVKCYKQIILRDLNPKNRDKSIYRGLERAAINWERLSRFALKEKIDLNDIKNEVRKRLLTFLSRECEDVSLGRKPSSINCPYRAIAFLASELGIYENQLPKNLKNICPQ